MAATPADPSYPGAHSAVSTTAAAVLTSVFGNQDPVTVTSEVVPGAVRTLRHYQAVATDAGLSRTYAGVHTRTDNQAGDTLGQRIAAFVLRRSASIRFGAVGRG